MINRARSGGGGLTLAGPPNRGQFQSRVDSGQRHPKRGMEWRTTCFVSTDVWFDQCLYFLHWSSLCRPLVEMWNAVFLCLSDSLLFTAFDFSVRSESCEADSEVWLEPCLETARFLGRGSTDDSRAKDTLRRWTQWTLRFLRVSQTSCTSQPQWSQWSAPLHDMSRQ